MGLAKGSLIGTNPGTPLQLLRGGVAASAGPPHAPLAAKVQAELNADARFATDLSQRGQIQIRSNRLDIA